ncbi:ECF RNA polymerase sigma-E factor [Planctomycetes bacterium Poly30]|uniref:ECF RNA polymerase sigma-E factor n=1 Tax=Saltatorellus ferox TaxID=2528018 RepID=A0A518EX66_9BACT|nr:ECF RNA polymerase sigma-E factor [Planctomycetes bacterium Poly30]
MQVSDLLHASPLTTPGGRAKLEQRIAELAKSGSKMASAAMGQAGSSGRLAPELDDEDCARVGAAFADDTLNSEQLRDAVSTALMDGFRKSTGRGTFGLLYELNAAHLLVQVAGRLRRYNSKADAGDVLQEVFFNVYRYPHRFDSSRDDAFRVWTAMIVRNTVLKHLRSRSTGGGNRREIPFEDLSDQPVSHGDTPLAGVLQDEANLECSRAYVTYLQLYIEFYTMLSDRERRALHLVEVDGVSYRDAAAALGIKLENLKMVIFRARKKIHRAMRRVFDGLPPDCKPARVGRPVGHEGDLPGGGSPSDALRS